MSAQPTAKVRFAHDLIAPPHVGRLHASPPGNVRELEHAVRRVLLTDAAAPGLDRRTVRRHVLAAGG